MAVSFSRMISRACPVCGLEVASELWLILHRQERPSLWARCRGNSIHVARCSRGHRNVINAPLVLFDPALDFVILSPASLTAEDHAFEQGDDLMRHLQATVGPEERERCLQRVEVVPRELLGEVLATPRLNLHDFAPGAQQTEELSAMYTLLRLADWGMISEAIENIREPPAVVAALRFEQAMHFNRLGKASPEYFEEAIVQCLLALDFYKRERFALRWAAIQSEMALAYAYRRQGNRRLNMREAIHCGELALEVFLGNRYPEDYAMVQTNRASALLESERGSQSAIDRAIEAYQAALSIYNRKSYPDDWAMAQSNLATAFMERTGTENQRKAVEALELALEILSPETSRHEWALAQMHLGLALSRLQEEQNAAQRVRAIAALRAADEVFRGDSHRHEDGYLRERIAITYNLGIALARSGDPYDLPEAARLLEQARSTFLAAGESDLVAECTQDLVRVFFKCLTFEPLRGQQYDISMRALETFEGEQDLEEVGKLFHEIAWRLSENQAVPKDRRMELSMRAAESALLILRTREQAEFRAKALANLGIIYLQRSSEGRHEDKLHASDCFEAALKILLRLEPTPERDELIGRIHVQSAGARM